MVLLSFRVMLTKRPHMEQLIKKSLDNLVSKKSVYDDHTSPHHDVTLGQMTSFVLYAFAALLLGVRTIGSFTRHTKPSHGPIEEKDGDKELNGAEENKCNGDVEAAKPPPESKRPPPPPPPTFNVFLRHVVVFGVVMTYFFMCDYVKVFPVSQRIYNEDTFLFLVFLLFLVGCAFTITPTKDVILNREQTEEWKGWMQVMFVWYHYFAAKDWYNWIRVYIACYVWMTGFGNFSFFWVRKDFSLWRVMKMMFRLNFLVLFVVITTNNEYMLYYICAMHTYWFVSVYVFMRVLNSWNEHRLKMAVKFAAYIVCNALIFEIPGACQTLFRPLSFILGMSSEKYPIMHEWEFRAGLDHWACLVGMLCAYNYPHFEALIKHLERQTSSASERFTQLACKGVMVTAGLVAGCVWYFSFMRQDKFEYNRTHCYTSMIPILCFIVLRNSFPVLRRYYIHMFAWLGKITLETYLSQLHIYLQGNAKQLIEYIGGHPLLTFSLATAIYLTISYILFNLTTEFSSFLIPKDMKLVLRQTAVGAVVVVAAVGVAFLLQLSIMGQHL